MRPRLERLNSDSPVLGALILQWKYNHQPLKGSTDKERPRVIPVHPELASALQWWRAEGWEAFMGRKPCPEDPIVPNVHKMLKRENDGFHTERSIYHRAHDAFEAAKLDVDWKAHHACRHAFITTARRCGAARDWIERITHNAKGTIVDHYTHSEWEPL